MPTPIEILMDPISWIFIGTYIILLILERLFPARDLPKIKGWAAKGVVFFFIYFYLATYLPLWVDPMVETYQLTNLSHLNLGLQVLIGLLLYEFLLYVWHWAMHRLNFLWRVFHQMHHSAERVDVLGANYFSITDMIGFTLIGTVSFALLMGLDVTAITYILIIVNLMAYFQHANIKTPQWIGYIVQRPESHSVHHQRGVHAYNYSDLPVFDIIFGTFRNPAEFPHEAGFYDGASFRMIEMFLFKDVSEEK